MAKAQSGDRSRRRPLTFRDVMARESWRDLPPIVVLSGDAHFMKELFIRRFVKTVFGASDPVLQRFQGPPQKLQLELLPLATVLDELRTPSFFSPYRVVVLDGADAFVAAHGESLLPFFDRGFSGGYLIALLDEKLDGRKKFSRRLAEKACGIECRQPFDRPPPWETRTPAWNSELSHWIVERARGKSLEIDLETAFMLHERAGTDLAVLEEELEKLGTYVAAKRSGAITPESITAIVGEIRENSVFLLVDLFLEGRRREALREARRLFSSGIASRQKAARTSEPIGLVLLVIGALVPRLRSLRRALAMQKEGATPEHWIRAGLVQRPFINRFERQLQRLSLSKIGRILERLYQMDRSMKTGGDAEKLLELVLVEFG